MLNVTGCKFQEEEPVACDRPQLANVGGFGFSLPERKCGLCPVCSLLLAPLTHGGIFAQLFGWVCTSEALGSSVRHFPSFIF